MSAPLRWPADEHGYGWEVIPGIQPRDEPRRSYELRVIDHAGRIVDARGLYAAATDEQAVEAARRLAASAHAGDLGLAPRLGDNRAVHILGQLVCAEAKCGRPLLKRAADGRGGWRWVRFAPGDIPKSSEAQPDATWAVCTNQKKCRGRWFVIQLVARATARDLANRVGSKVAAELLDRARAFGAAISDDDSAPVLPDDIRTVVLVRRFGADEDRDLVLRYVRGRDLTERETLEGLRAPVQIKADGPPEGV